MAANFNVSKQNTVYYVVFISNKMLRIIFNFNIFLISDFVYAMRAESKLSKISLWNTYHSYNMETPVYYGENKILRLLLFKNFSMSYIVYWICAVKVRQTPFKIHKISLTKWNIKNWDVKTS